MKMKSRDLFSTICLRSLALGAVIFSAPAFAQDEPAQTPAAPSDPDVREDRLQSSEGAEEAQGSTDTDIIVTGSRIQRPNLNSNIPISSVAAEEVLATGDLSLGDALTDLPALRPTLTQASSGRSFTNAGLNLLDLRGLGIPRTLVLVNGRRHITAQAGSFGVDINTIPTDLVERVDIVTGGNSAIYGSDAVAGVVNFVLRRNFEGLRVRGQAGVSDEGDRGNYFLSLTAGHNFAGGRGNIAFSGEYSRQETLFFSDRDNLTGAFSGRSLFSPTENVGPNLNPSNGPIRGAEPTTGNGIPDRTFLTGIRNNNISEGGLYTASCPVAPAPGESDAQFQARRGASCSGIPNSASSNPLAQLGRTYVFLGDGSVIQNPCIQDLRQFNSTVCVGGLGSTLRLTGMLSPGVERKVGNLLGSYEFDEALRVFAEAKYVNIDAVQATQATFFNNTFNINNPFLSDAARTAITATLAPGQQTFTALRYNTDFGALGSNLDRETYRIVVGADGRFNDDWRYEVALNYGRLETSLATAGNVRLPHYSRAINAVRDAAGQIVCAVNADADPANDDSACVPVDLFGSGRLSQAALDYITHTSTREERAEQYNATAFVSGDLSQLFELPGGPIGFALGAEYRREEAFADSDPITRTRGETFISLGSAFAPPAYEIKELFGEVRIPLIADRRFFDELTVEAAGRLSDYNLGSTGTVFAYNVGGTWAPSRDLRFRVGYSQSVRAPTLSDLYTSASNAFAPLGLQDPCGQQNINNNPNRARNCAAAGVPLTQTFTVNGVTTTEPFTNRGVSVISGISRGNIELEEERGRSLTVGLVAQPRFIPGLSLTVDYFRVKISNAIAQLGVQTILDLCFDSPSGIENQYCALIFRNPNGTFAGQPNVNHAGTTVTLTPSGPAFIQQPFNFARTETSGIDVDLNYRTTLGGVGLDVRGLVSYAINRNNFTNINDPTFSNRQKGELGDPAWRGQLSARLDFGNWDFGYQLRYIGRQTLAGEYETQNSHQGRPPTDPDAFPRIWFPSVFYHSFRFSVDVGERLNFYAGVDNAFDRLPPFRLVTGDAGAATAGAPWDNIGRYFYFGAITNF